MSLLVVAGRMTPYPYTGKVKSYAKDLNAWAGSSN